MLARLRQMLVALATLVALLAFLVPPPPASIAQGVPVQVALAGGSGLGATGGSASIGEQRVTPLRAPPPQSARGGAKVPERRAPFVPQGFAASPVAHRLAAPGERCALDPGDSTIATSRIHADCTVLLI